MRSRLHGYTLIAIRIIFLLGVLYSFFVSGDFETGGLVATGLILSFIPQIIERRYNVNLPVLYELTIVAFIFASLFVGEFLDAYERYWWWDKALHASSGVILGYVGFMTLYILNLKQKLRVSPGVIAFLTFSMAMAAAGVWEVIEFGADRIFGTYMQNGLEDTMIDIILGGLGGLLAAGVAYWHFRWPDSSPMTNMLKKFLKNNPALDPRSKQRKQL